MPTILVVDDERSALWIVQHYLKTAGYGVIASSSPAEAEAIFRSSPESVDLLVTDVVMPEMSGMEFAKRLLDIAPDLPVLFTSGFTSEVWMPPHKNCVYGFVSKPASKHELLSAIGLLLRTASKLKKSPRYAEPARIGAVA